MSQKLLVRDLKAESSRISAALNICPDDDRFMSWLNEFEERAVNQGRWWGSIVETQLCLDPTSGCFTFPRQVGTVERLAVNGQPVAQENQWFPFTRLLANLEPCGGCGSTRGNCGCGLTYRDQGAQAVSFATTLGANKVIRSYCLLPADVGKQVTYQGYDINGQWVTTLQSGVRADGERVTLAIPFVDTATQWAPGSPTAVIKDVTQANVPVYSYDLVELTERALAVYEPGETRPVYRTGRIPGLRQAVGNRCCTTSTTTPTTISAIVSLQHIPLVSDGDWVIFRNLAAYKAGMIAVKAYEENDIAKGDYHFYGTQSGPVNARGAMRVVNRGGAIPLLQAELFKQTGGRTNAFIYAEETNKMVRQMQGFW